MRLPVQSPPVQRDLLMSGSRQDEGGIQAAQGFGGIFGPFGPFGPGPGPGGPGGAFGLFAPQPPRITYEINTWVQSVPPDPDGAGCRLMTAHTHRMG
jgi:hypothetical protein